MESIVPPKRTTEDFVNLKDTVKNNPFFEKKTNVNDKNSVPEELVKAQARNDSVSQQHLVSTLEIKRADLTSSNAAHGNEKPPLSLKKSFSCEVHSSTTFNHQQNRDESPKLLDILRNFDSKPKTEKVLFQTDRNISKTVSLPPNQPKTVVSADNALKRTGSVSDRRLLFEKPKPESVIQTMQRSLKSAQEQAPKIDPKNIEVESLVSISERSKAFEEPVQTNKLTRSMSIVERKKMFMKKDAKPIVPPTTIHSMRSGTKVSTMPTISDEAETEVPVAKVVESRAIKSRQSNISALINQLQSKGEDTPSKSVEVTKKSVVPHVVLQVHQHEESDEGELESKRSDSGAFVDNQNEAQLHTSSNLEIPKIDIGSIFDEQDSWMTTLLNNDSLGESAETLMVSEESDITEPAKHQPIREPSPVPQTEEIVHEQEEIIIESKESFDIKEKKKSVSFGVAWNGGLAEYRYYAVDPTDEDVANPSNSLGVLLLKSCTVLM
jgi:hypothetical protein